MSHTTTQAGARRLLTVGALARRVNLRVHQVEYFLRSRGVQPIGWAGNARVFDEEVVAQLQGEIAAADSARPAPGVERA